MHQRPWDKFPMEYRAETMQQLAGWIEAGESGSVIGLAGCGRSNLLQFLCHRPDVLPIYLPEWAERLALLLVDLSHLPANDPTTLYLVILREFYWYRERFSPDIQERVTALFMENRATQNPFLAQTALHELLFAFQAGGIRVVLVLNHFDRFAEQANRQTLDTLRGLRDGFKETVCFIAGMVHEAIYLPDPELFGDMLHTLLNRHICWVGAMNDNDARSVITQATHTAPTPPRDEEIKAMIDLTGGFPALLRAIGYWWLEQPEKPPLKKRRATLMADHHILYWLGRLWDGLTHKEQEVLLEVRQTQARGKKGMSQKERQRLERRHGPTLRRLNEKGICRLDEQGWHVRGALLAVYLKGQDVEDTGELKIDPVTKQILKGEQVVELTQQQDRLLRFLIEHPYEPHDYDVLAVQIWSEEAEDNYVARTPGEVQGVVSQVRKVLNEDASDPHYLINWRGDPGGYRCYPEGQPK